MYEKSFFAGSQVIKSENPKKLSSSSKYYQQRNNGLIMLGNMVKDVVSGASRNTQASSKDTCAYKGRESRRGAKGPGEAIDAQHSSCSRASFTSPSPVPCSEQLTV